MLVGEKRKMSNKTCYVVMLDCPEGSSVCSICLSEKTAKREFYKEKRKTIKEAKKHVAWNIRRERDKDTIRYYNNKIVGLKKLRYPGTNDIGVWVWESPIVRTFELLE